jgi:hypothetical protein
VAAKEQLNNQVLNAFNSKIPSTKSGITGKATKRTQNVESRIISLVSIEAEIEAHNRARIK